MAQAEHREVLSVDKDKLFEVITKYEDYPRFVDGCTSVKVERKGPGQARVTYQVSMMKDITYTLDHREDSSSGIMEWTLVDSDFMSANSGRWQLRSDGSGKTDVLYSVEIDFKIPVPGFILNRLIKGNLPSMVRSFRKRAMGE